MKRSWNKYRLLIPIALTLTVLVTGSCLKDLITESKDWRTVTENALQDAINALDSASADWQQILKDAQGKLTEDLQSTVRNEIANLASRSIATTGVELRCNVDFLRRRVQQSLERIKTKFLGGQPEPVEPALCQVVPLAVERALVPNRISKIEFYGYDFDRSSDLKVFHVRSNGRQDVTHQLDRPTHYAMTLKFGANGVQLDNRSQRFSLEWGGNEISTIAVIQPQVPTCKARSEKFLPSPVTFVPPHTRGDRDFKGHGPTSTARVGLLTDSRRIRAKVFMKAYESNANNSAKSDHTTASGSRIFSLYTAPTGWRIDRVLGPSATSHTYRDSNHAADSFSMGSGSPVNRFVFIGDTKGSESGTRTKVDVTFNRLTVELTETKNCVSPRAVMSLHETNMIDDATFRRLEAGAQREIRSMLQPAEVTPESRMDPQ